MHRLYYSVHCRSESSLAHPAGTHVSAGLGRLRLPGAAASVLSAPSSSNTMAESSSSCRSAGPPAPANVAWSRQRADQDA